jgi:Ca2+-binding RTX toxin-like protein
MRRTVSLLVAMVAAMFLACGAAFATSSLSPIADTGTANTDGRVTAILASGDKVYLGGSFTQVDGVTRDHLAALDASTGQLTDWNPGANGNVLALAASADGTRIYAGGAFTAVGGTTHKRLVSLDASTGAVNTGFKIGLGSPVRAITVSGNSLYIGGDFSSVQGQSRSRLARIDATTAALDPGFAPAADKTVRALSLSADGARLYVGGDFTTISGQATPNFAGLEPTTGALVWQPLTTPNGPVFDITPQGGTVYSAEAGPGGAAEAYDAATGTQLWRRKGDGDVQGVVVIGDTLYMGGHFTHFMGNDRRFFAAVDATTGALDAWNPNGGGTLKGVWVFEEDPSGTRLYAGGDFTKVSGATHMFFARFSEGLPPAACTITGTSSADTLNGTSADDVICGGTGNDTIKGLEGNDILRGEGGSDQLYGGAADDTLDGGPGTDAANFSGSSAPVSASLADNTATGEGSDTLVSIENLVGSPGADTLTGSGADNSLTGGNGADTISAEGGADRLTGSAGDDIEHGGPGNDTVTGSGGADNLFGDEDDDTVNSQDAVEGNDSLDGGPQVNGDTAITDATEMSIVDFP